MSYTSVEEIPFNVRLCYDEDDIIQWLAAYNNACDLIKDGTYTVPDYCISDAMYAREIAFETCKYLPSSRFVECSATVEVSNTRPKSFLLFGKHMLVWTR